MRTALRGSAVRALSYGRGVVPAGQQIAKGMSLPAPVGGWDAVSSLADMPEDRAITLDNWFPRPDSVEIRKGYQLQCAGMGSAQVESLLVYEGLTSSSAKLFAATSGNIYDVTSSGAASITTETGLSNNRWQYTNFTTSGGKFLWICNGTDAPRHWNGSVWAQPSITGITATDIIHVNAHKHRLWFVLRDSTKAAYLATSAIAGAANTFELGSIFTKGGYLNAMATWTRDGGSGPDDYAVFISSKGQIALYQGTDPSAAGTWSLVGVFDTGSPIGRRCFVKVGPDLALINIDGVLPLQAALASDRAAAAKLAITKNINNAMNDAARSYASNFGWELTSYPRGTMAILNVPIQEGRTQHQYVMNTLTGAWCRFKGQNFNCFAVFNDLLYGGGNDGNVYKADTGPVDLDEEIDAIGQCAYNYYKSRGVLKNFGLIRANVTTDSDVRPAIGMSTDFQDNAIVGTPATAAIASALYDSAIYDSDVYAVESRAINDWASIAAQGHSGSIHFRARTGGSSGSSAVSIWGVSQWGIDSWSGSALGNVVLRISAFDVIYKQGGFM